LARPRDPDKDDRDNVTLRVGRELWKYIQRLIPYKYGMSPSDELNKHWTELVEEDKRLSGLDSSPIRNTPLTSVVAVQKQTITSTSSNNNSEVIMSVETVNQTMTRYIKFAEANNEDLRALNTLLPEARKYLETIQKGIKNISMKKNRENYMSSTKKSSTTIVKEEEQHE
jgi:hypothetical protein